MSLINLLYKLLVISPKNASISNTMTTCLFTKHAFSSARDGGYFRFTLLTRPIFVFPVIL